MTEKFISINIHLLKQKRLGTFLNQYALYTGQFITKVTKTWRVKREVYSETIWQWSFNFLLTGVAISPDCIRIQFLFQRHNFNVADLLLETLEQKVVTFFLWHFNKNRIREQLDDMRTPVIHNCCSASYSGYTGWKIKKFISRSPDNEGPINWVALS